MKTRHLIFLTIVGSALLLTPKPARAAGGIGIQAGYHAPTREASKLLDHELQLGLRFFLPPYTPFGRIPSKAMMLDLGFDMPARVFGNLGGDNVSAQMANIGALYRYNFPVGRRTLLFGGAGVRVSTMLGFVPEALRDLLFMERFTGGVNVAAGTSILLSRQALFDLRVGYGVFGFEYFEVTGGLVVLF